MIVSPFIIVILQAMGEMSGEDGLGSQSYVPFSLPKDPDTAEDTTKYVSCHINFLDPEGGSQNATLVQIVVVVIRSPKKSLKLS